MQRRSKQLWNQGDNRSRSALRNLTAYNSIYGAGADLTPPTFCVDNTLYCVLSVFSSCVRVGFGIVRETYFSNTCWERTYAVFILRNCKSDFRFPNTSLEHTPYTRPCVRWLPVYSYDTGYSNVLNCIITHPDVLRSVEALTNNIHRFASTNWHRIVQILGVRRSRWYWTFSGW